MSKSKGSIDTVKKSDSSILDHWLTHVPVLRAMLLLHNFLTMVPLLGVNLLILVLGWHSEYASTEDTGILISRLRI